MFKQLLVINKLLDSLLMLGLAGCQSVVTPNSPIKTALTDPLAAHATTEGVCNYNQATDVEAELLAAGWKKTFEDNFNVSPSNSLNPNWNVWVGGAFNNELQMFTANSNNLDITPDPDDADNSLLVIKAIKESVTGPKYRQDIDATPTNFEFTSARIESKTMFAPTRTSTQVRFVSRIKLPSGYGMWPAFWLYGNKWPTNGEIDILEARGNEPFLFQTNYFFGRQANVNLVKNAANYITTQTSLIDCWHVYELIWTKESLTFRLDGQVVGTNSGGYVSDLFAKPERITLNQAVGGDFFYKDGSIPTPSQIPLNEGEGVMLVDWVKVYAKR
jgi:beta-glucanase (GH16 family)